MRRAAPRLKQDAAALGDAFADLRIVKDEGEIALLEKASAATAQGHLAAMRAARAGIWEYQVQAVMEQAFRMAGCPETGYDSIVAGGRNGAILHYHHNHDRLGAGDLLLIDAAAEYRGYTADVTRAFPVSGRFTRRQRDVYEAVLRTQEGCLDFARAGVTSMDVQHRSEELLAAGLKDLGLATGSWPSSWRRRPCASSIPTGSATPWASTSTTCRAARAGACPSARAAGCASAPASSPASS